MKNYRISKGYGSLLKDIKVRIREAQYSALKAVNKELIVLYWDIGKMIVKRQKGDKWGKAVVVKLAEDLQKEFPETRGFSASNLWRMRQFYESYCRRGELATLSRELPWFHNVVILQKTETDEERKFYLEACIQGRWSFRELGRQMDVSLFERTRYSKKVLAGPSRTSAPDAFKNFKDEYVLDFLGMKDPYGEKDLRKAILGKLKDFFLELDRHFTLAGEEYRVSVGGEDYFVDLLFFHRLLRCFVAVELKVGGFKPEYARKMQFYLSALDETAKLEKENPSVGIILCKSKNDEIVRIAVSKAASPIKVANYKTRLIDRKLLKQKLHSLPSF